jgi:hypothetical protein
MTHDHRSLALEMLADSEAEMRDRLVHLEADIGAYRELARAAIHALHALRLELDRMRAAHHRLVDAYRRRHALTIGDPSREVA